MLQFTFSANAMIENARRGNESDLIAAKAQLKKTEMKVHSLEAQLEQKMNENMELNNMVDDLIAKVGQ